VSKSGLTILNVGQKAQLLALAKEQEADIKRFAEMWLPLIKAFRLNLEDKIPTGSAGLDRQAVMKYSADLYALDGKLSSDRAKVMANVLRGLTPAQKAALAQLKFGDSATWSNVTEPLDRRSK
jgi:Spy/CpxP family protein refolding chaperone